MKGPEHAGAVKLLQKPEHAASATFLTAMLFTLLLPPSGRYMELFSLTCAHQGASQAACSQTDPFGALVVFSYEIPLNKRKKNICYGNQC